MRLSAFFFAMILTCPAGAAEWKEFLSPDHSFTVHFPTDPNIEMTIGCIRSRAKKPPFTPAIPFRHLLYRVAHQSVFLDLVSRFGDFRDR
jgi:hypothetical protein